MQTKQAARVAGVIVGLEAIALIVLAGWQISALSVGDTDSAVSAVALIVLTLIGAVILAAFAVGSWGGRSWARSGGIVAQVLILAVALGAATGEYAHPLTAALIALPAAIALVALILAARAAAAAAKAAESSSDAGPAASDRR